MVIDHRHTLMIVLALWACLGRADDALPSSLNARNQNLELVQGRFEQSRTIQVLPAPLLSHGQFLFRHGEGITWTQQAPFENTLFISEEGIRWQDQPQSTDGDLASAMIGKIFVGVIAGQLDDIAQFFTVDAQGSTEQWRLVLEPRNAAVANYIGKIIIEGAALIERVEMQENNGDQTQIVFFNDLVKRKPE